MYTRTHTHTHHKKTVAVCICVYVFALYLFIFSPLFYSVQFYFIYTTPNHNNSLLKELYIIDIIDIQYCRVPPRLST